MKKNKRPTKLEEASLSVHVDIDGNKDEALTDALFQVRQVVQLIVGQDDIENHDVTLVVQVLLRERPREEPERPVGRDVGLGQRF